MTVKEPKPVPAIVGEDDLRLTDADGAVSKPQVSQPVSVGKGTKAPSSYEPKNLQEKISLARMTFAQQLVGWGVGLIFILSLIQHFFPSDGSQIATALDTLKMVVTTGIGFVFGREVSSKQE